jgi:hypothetical protein
MLFGAFRPPKPENRIVRQYALDGQACKMLAVLVRAQGKTVAVRQMPASVVEKARTAWVR